MLSVGAWVTTLAALTAQVGAPCVVGAGQPFIQTFKPSGNVQYWAVAQDSLGLLYFARRDDVLEYDGSTWRHLLVDNVSTTRSLAAGADGRLYAGAQDEFGYFEPSSTGKRYVSLTPQVEEQDRGFGDVWKTHVTSQGVFFQTNSHLFRWDGDRMVTWRPQTTFHFSFVVRDRLYILERGTGLLRLEGEELAPVPGGERFAADRVYVMLPYGDDEVLVGARDQGLFLSRPDGMERFPTSADSLLVANLIYHGARLDDGTIAIATRGGVFLFDESGQCRELLDRDSGLPSAQVTYLFQDRDRALWIATGQGFARLDVHSPLTYFDKAAGLSGIVIAVIEHAGGTYVGTADGLFEVSLPGQQARRASFRPAAGIEEAVFDLASLDESLIVAAQGGIHQIRDSNSRKIADGTALAVHPVGVAPSVVLVGRMRGVGLLRRVGERWIDEGLVPGVEGAIVSIDEGPDGDVWLGGRNGVAFRIPAEDGQWPPIAVESFSAEAGVPPGRITIQPLAGRLHLTSEAGIYRFDESAGSFLPDSSFGANLAGGNGTWVTHLREADDGSVWITHGQGSGPSRVTVLDTRREPIPAAGGLLSSVLSAAIYSIVPGDTGIMWLGTDEALVRYDLGRQPQVPAPRRTELRAVRAGSDSVIFAGRSRGDEAPSAVGPLRSERNGLRFDFALPSFAGPVEFAGMLEGFEDDWWEWTADGMKEYTNLPGGRYRFRVRARDSQGIEAEEATFDFRVLPPPHRSLAAYFVYVIVLGSTVLAIHRLRVRRLKQRGRELRELVAVRTRELETSERRYRDMFESSSDIILALDEEGRILSINSVSEDILGYDRESLLLRSLEDLTVAGTPRAVGLFDSGQGKPLELDMRRGDGSSVTLALNARRIDDEDNPAAWAVVARDVTDRKQLERELLQATKMEAIGRLAGGVAHDFNNLLTVVRGYSALLEADAATGFGTRRELAEIRRAAQRGAALTEQLLAFGRKQVLAPRDFDLNELIAANMNMLASMMGEDVSIEPRLDPDLMPVHADPNHIVQVLVNLAGNAREAMPQGGRLTIETANSNGVEAAAQMPDGRHVVMRVSDTGSGISDDVQKYIFEPFFTTKAENSGLGLSVVHGIVEQSGGRITIDSAVGDGTTFTVLLPAAVGECVEGELTRATEQPDGQGRTVLVAEDDRAVRVLIETYLGNCGYVVLAAASGEEALELSTAHDGTIDALVTDVIMPGIDGVQLATEVAQTRPTVKVLFISGYADDALRDLELGADRDADFLSKPFAPDALARKLAHLLAPPPAQEG